MNKPLAGKSVLVTRPRAQSGGLIEELEQLGAIVYSMPVIEIHPLESYEPLDNALRSLDTYDWIVFTSVNGVKAVEERLQTLGIEPENLRERRLAAIGPSTAAELARVARSPDLVPAKYVSEAIAEAFARLETRGPTRFLLARADIARKDLANLLREQGHAVDEVAAYRIVRGEGAQDLPEAAPDYITLTSSSAARSTLEMLRENGREEWMRTSALACIGPITSATVRELGYEPAAEAEEYTALGLVKALVNHATKTPSPAWFVVGEGAGGEGSASTPQGLNARSKATHA